jgi:hypothetical protein
MYDTLHDVSKDPTFILESCKPFSNLIDKLMSEGQKGLDDKNKFFVHLKNVYKSKKAATEADVADCTENLNEIERATGMDVSFFNLKKSANKR